MKGKRYLGMMLALSLAASAFGGLATRALAQENPGIPRLGEHVFVPNTLVRGPFIRSYFRSDTGLGSTRKVRIPVVTLPDSTVLVDLSTKLTVATLSFEFQYAMKSWVAVRGRLSIVGRLGTSTEALISEGITGVGSFELGWIFKLWENQRNLLSLDLSTQRNQGTFINLLDWLDRIIEDGGLVPGNSLVRSRDSLRGVATLRYAHSFSPLLGMSATGGLGYGEKLNREGNNDFSYDLGAGISCNLDATTRVPLGLYLGFALNNRAEGNARLADDIYSMNLRINYMRFSDFVIGLDVGFALSPLRGLDEDLKASAYAFNLQYFF